MLRKLSLAAALFAASACLDSAIAFHKTHGASGSATMQSSCARSGRHDGRCRGWHPNSSKRHYHHHDRRRDHGMTFG